VRLLNAIDEQREKPAACVWENVPGVLSTTDNAFGCFLGELAGSGCELQPPNGKRWGNAGCINGPRRAIAWRVLDAQYFGVAQRRRRVFVVASARDGIDPGQVLFEFEGSRRRTPPRHQTETPVAALTACGVGTCGADDNQAQAGHLIKGYRQVAFGEYADDQAASTMKARDYKDATDLVASFSQNQRGELRESEIAPSLTIGGGKPGQGYSAARVGQEVRRLTPTECERLQGFPDNHTQIPWRGKPAGQCPDGPRYKALGNTKAVPVLRWIGRRLLEQLKS
jgi:DNA (cytosine-5)-methyltransferase 1